MKTPSLISRIAIFTPIVACILGLAEAATADGKPKAATTWSDLGYDKAPEGYAPQQIPLFEGLNKSRGSWSFKGSLTESGTAMPVEGSLKITGSFKDGMIPMWNLVFGWPAEEPAQGLHYSIMASPGENGFQLMLARIGPAKNGAGGNPLRAMFQGKWDLKSRTIAWSRMAPSSLHPGLPAKRDEGQEVKESFEMVIAESGAISIRFPEKGGQPLLAGKAMARVGKPFVEKAQPKKAKFATTAEVSDPRLKRCLPPGAKDITLLRERGGHFARYTVSDADFHKFLNRLWKAEKENSAHQRDQMHGEGEAVKKETLATRFGPLGWKPLKKAVIYYGPSKASGAMTTYYFDKEAGVAYHDTGYW